MKIGDLVRWKTKPSINEVGLVVKLEEPSFVHVLWSNQDEVWTWVHRANVEVISDK